MFDGPELLAQIKPMESDGPEQGIPISGITVPAGCANDAPANIHTNQIVISFITTEIVPSRWL